MNVLIWFNPNLTKETLEKVSPSRYTRPSNIVTEIEKPAYVADKYPDLSKYGDENDLRYSDGGLLTESSIKGIFIDEKY